MRLRVNRTRDPHALITLTSGTDRRAAPCRRGAERRAGPGAPRGDSGDRRVAYLRAECITSTSPRGYTARAANIHELRVECGERAPNGRTDPLPQHGARLPTSRMPYPVPDSPQARHASGGGARSRLPPRLIAAGGAHCGVGAACGAAAAPPLLTDIRYRGFSRYRDPPSISHKPTSGNASRARRGPAGRRRRPRRDSRSPRAPVRLQD